MNPVARVRFAPSPTGELHLGGARTALFNYLYARQNGGRFYLRIEDTDVERSREEYVRQICDCLRWLGLNWDGPIVFQSGRKENHQAAVRTLLRGKKAYRCFCTVEELTGEREEAVKSGVRYQYSGKCRKLTNEQIKAKLNRAEPFCVRLWVPRGKTRFMDGVYGEIIVQNKEIDDFIIQRTDGTPTYNLTVVVDDSDMKISLVLRGEDHLANTPKQILIYKALGQKIPRFAHLPMILAASGQRLSKRHGATGVQHFRDGGYLPEALVNYLALLGWSPGDDREIFTVDELIAEFSLERVVKKGAVFDEKKLQWVSSQHMAMQSSRSLLDVMRQKKPQWHTGAPEAYVMNVIDLVKDRTKSLAELDTYTDYFFSDPTEFDKKAAKRRWEDENVNYFLEKYMQSLAGIDSWDLSSLEAHLRMTAERLGIPAGALIHPTRIALTGYGVGPPLFDIMVLLEKETVLRRLKFAVENLPAG